MLVIISTLFVIGLYSHVHLIGIHDVDAWIWQEKLFFLPFSLLLKLICEIRQTWICVIISILFFIGHYNHVHLIGIHEVDALIWQEKLFFPPFSLQ